jgi:LysR family transcriptional regulator (chromosome initiation inhibitor)
MSLLHPNLQAFMAVVERKTVQDAARKIGLTQTGVTQRIRSLERELSITLFIRSRKGMQLTTEGESLLRYCQSATELEGRLGFEQTQEETKLQISGPSSFMRGRVIPQIATILKNYPQLKVQFDLMDLQSPIHKLKSGESQIVIASIEDVSLEMDSKILKPERYILAGPYSWRKRKISEIVKNETIIDFNHDDQYTLNFLKKHNLFLEALKGRHFINNSDGLLSLVAGGAGYSMVALETALELIETKKLIDLMPGKFFDLNNLCLAWYPRPFMPEYMGQILKSIMN